jgi:hypothetical protein
VKRATLETSTEQKHNEQALQTTTAFVALAISSRANILHLGRNPNNSRRPLTIVWMPGTATTVVYVILWCRADKITQNGRQNENSNCAATHIQCIISTDCSQVNTYNRPQHSPIDMVHPGVCYHPLFGSWKCVYRGLSSGAKKTTKPTTKTTNSTNSDSWRPLTEPSHYAACSSYRITTYTRAQSDTAKPNPTQPAMAALTRVTAFHPEHSQLKVR